MVAAAVVSASAFGAWFFAQFRRNKTARLVAEAIESARVDPAAQPGQGGPLAGEAESGAAPLPVAPKLAPDWREARSGNLVTDSEPIAGEPLGVDDFIELISQYDGPSRHEPQQKQPPQKEPSQKKPTRTETVQRPDTSEAKTSEAKTGIFYGWIVVAATFVILAVTSGVGFYNASVILAAATKELDASVGSVSGATGMFFAISGLTGFAFAKRLDAADIRWFFVAGGLIGAIALLGLRWVTSVVELYAFFALFGVGFGMAGLVPATTLVTRWFERRRAVALSIASTGLSVGGIALTPVAAWLIDRRTLSGASPYLALIWVVGIIPIAVLILRSYPSDRGLRPDGDTPSPAADRQATGLEPDSAAPDMALDVAPEVVTATGRPEVAGLDFASARSTRFFIALCAAYALIFLGQVGAIAQLFNLVLERADNATAATALSTLALTSVVARLVGGVLVLRLPTRGFTALLAVVQAAALVLLATADTPITLILTSAFLGISIGNLLMLQPLLLAEAFGVANYPRIYSFNQLVGTLGVAGGPLLLGVIRDAYDYRIAMLLAAAASFGGFVFIAVAGPIGAVQSLWRATPSADELDPVRPRPA